MKEMEMPVDCSKCGKWVELDETRISPLEKKKLICKECYLEESLVKDIVDEIRDIQYMLDNNDPEVKGDRRGWKSNIKVLKDKLIKLGYDVDYL